MGSPDLATLSLLASAATSLGTAEIATAGGQSIKLEQKAPATGSKIHATTPGDFAVDAGAKVAVEAATEIKLGIAGGGPTLKMDANGISLKMGPQAEIQVKTDQVVLKLGSSIACRLAQDKATLTWGTSQVSLSASGPELKGAKITSG